MTAIPVLMVAVWLVGAESAKPHIKAALAAYEAGRADEKERRFQRAVDLFHRAIEIEPTFLEAYEHLINVNLDAGQRLEAAACITRFLEIHPTAVGYRNTLGTILLEQNQTERALAQFSLVLQWDPFNADGLFGFATAARQSGMEDRAADAIERGRKRYPLDERFTSVRSVRPK